MNQAHTVKHIGYRFDVCDCGATRWRTQPGERPRDEGWHTCALCCVTPCQEATR